MNKELESAWHSLVEKYGLKRANKIRRQGLPHRRTKAEIAKDEEKTKQGLQLARVE